MLPSIDPRMELEAFQRRRQPLPCPDCGAEWPAGEDRCPRCLLHVEDLVAAADLLDRIEQSARERA